MTSKTEAQDPEQPASAGVLAFPDPPPDPHDDSIDYALAFGQMIEALLPYWERQESMRPDDAIRKLVNEHQLYHDVLSDIADRVNAYEPYSDWAARVLGRSA
jgi:hypothetical protein